MDVIELEQWPEIIKLAFDTKTIGLLQHGLEARGIEVPDAIQQQLSRLRFDLLKSGLFNLAGTIKASEALSVAGIECIAFKGAIQAYSTYGAWDKRRSADVDILVRKDDFKSAEAALSAGGFVNILQEKSSWWDDHLGEVPFQSKREPGLVIDLHHQLQQPGGPFPAHIESFFANASAQRFGSKDVLVMANSHRMLVTAIGYGKSIREGAGWLHNAHELLYVWHNLNAEERKEVLSCVKRHGLERLFDDAISNARAVFGIKADGFGASDADYVMRDSAIGSKANPRFFRSRKLWQWSAGNPPQRIWNFTDGMIRVLRSNLARKRSD